MNDETPDQLYVDMSKLNALYEELMWDNEDILESSWITTLKRTKASCSF